jgi:hypothetical protein
MLTGISIVEIYFTMKLLNEVSENIQYGNNVSIVNLDMPCNSYYEYNMEFYYMYIAFLIIDYGAELFL